MLTTEGDNDIRYLPHHRRRTLCRIRYPFWYRSLRNYAQTLCRGLDETGALWMVACPSEWDTHPDNNITPAVPAVLATPAIARVATHAGVPAQAAVTAFAGSPAQPALTRVRPTMLHPPNAVAANTTTGVVANFNRLWTTFGKWMEAETQLSAAIILRLGPHCHIR